MQDSSSPARRERSDSEASPAAKSERERPRRARRSENGMALTAGVSKTPRREKFSRSVALLRAALEVWEAKHGMQTSSVWRRRSQCEGS